MKDLVSVIMSTYDEDVKLVAESIDSILNQTYTNLEFIIVLDNPNNISLRNLLISYTDPRIKLLFNEKNIGLVKSLNYALGHCKGTYIARMDADDISKKERLEIQKKYLEENNIDFVFTDVAYIDETGNKLFESRNRALNPIQVKKALEKINVSNHPTWFLKREIYDSLHGYRDINYCEDYDFSLRALNSGFIIGKINKSTLLYRIRKDSISRSNALNQFLNMRGLSRLYRQGKIENSNDVENMKLLSKKISTNRENNKFNMASYHFNQGTEMVKKGSKIKGCVSLLKSLFISKYYILKFYDLYRYKNAKI
ncbi:glycosyltransferase family 2 protein [Priestia megaterium]|uniref:glycosyltransferase family 2 protein n=1 Tax=Priestia megaterium TaxID=1404 RepID=UPI00234E51C2|nr:glycosyltransferase [Priestia megaterium]MDC7783894.1 glycosyltransferase [Priestia megaterium]